MDIKKINERVENFLQIQNEEVDFVHGEKGLKISGSKKDVSNLIQKLEQEYGDLTIPEFIDMLIEKQKSGEEILDESLNEKFWGHSELSSHKLGKLLGYTGGSNDHGSAGALSKNFPMLDSDSFYFRVEERNKELCKLIGNIRVLNCKQGDIKNIPGIENTNTYKDNEGMIKTGISALKKLFGDAGYAQSGYVYDGVYREENERISFVLDIYPEEDLQEQIDYLYYCLDVASKAMLKYYMDVKLPKMKEEIEINNTTKKNVLDRRKQILLQAKEQAPKNTTIKQALSKSSIAKKIQALQNPTSEQLARILAAIGEE